ncbi:dTDP-4-dehydrorhamnose reductase [soil metagenome]
MKSLVIGASGQVGALLYRGSQRAGHCIGTYLSQSAPDLVPLDLRDEAGIADLFRQYQPDVCYLPAAMTHVDRAELYPEECQAINEHGVDHVIEAARKAGSFLVYLSTDHVFGERDTPWRESEPTCPLSVYAASKVAAERAIREALPGRHLIARTSWVFGPDRQEKNFLYRLRRTLTAGERLGVPPGEWGQPTYGPDLARTIRHLVRRKAYGTIHIVGPQAMTRLNWALMLADEMGFSTEEVGLDWSVDNGSRAPRPQHLRLSRQKLLRYLFTDPIRDPRLGIRATLKLMQAEVRTSKVRSSHGETRKAG